MKEKKCLFCYQELSAKDLETEAGKSGYHEKCSKKIFGKKTPPILDFTKDEILELANQVVRSQKTVTGVQPKLSLGITDKTDLPERFTIVGLWGEYILKPQSEVFANLPENEDLTMHLAQLSKIKTVEHSLIRLKSGDLAYITRRIDRVVSDKLHMEDMCQLTERLTEHKYKGSYEQIAKAIKKYSAYPGLDVTDFFEVLLFSFLTGNNDMHLKNFSLLKTNKQYSLCPAYDLVSSQLVVEDDDEEMALNLNGKKKKLKRKDFVLSMQTAGINEKVISNIFRKYEKLTPKWKAFIEISFLPEQTKKDYINMIDSKLEQLEMKVK